MCKQDADSAQSNINTVHGHSGNVLVALGMSKMILSESDSSAAWPGDQNLLHVALPKMVVPPRLGSAMRIQLRHLALAGEASRSNSIL